MSLRKEDADAFINSLLMLKEFGNSKALADLRRSLSQESRAYEYVLPYVSDEKEAKVAVFVAGCFATAPNHNGSVGNFGCSCNVLWGMQDYSDGVKTRFGSLLVKDVNIVKKRIAYMIRWIANSSIPVNYHQLYRDLYYWDYDVRLRWSIGFYDRIPGVRK